MRMSITSHLRDKYNKSALSRIEAAKELNISVATLDRLRKDGKLRGKKVGKRILFSHKVIEDFLEK